MEALPESTPKAFATTGRSRKGEAWVWLTACGLALGILMALGLLLLILVKGVNSFWPRQIELLEVQRDGHTEVIAGYVVQRSEARNAEGEMRKQVQIFRGNKEIYGEAFLFIDQKDILKQSRPQGLMLVERLEFGPAILYPQQLRTPKGTFEAGTPEYDRELGQLIEKSEEVREQTLKVERKQIGANARKMQELDIAERVGDIPAGEAAARRATLQAEFDRLMKVATRLRASMEGYVFVGRTADGQVLEYPGDKLLGVFDANGASFPQRIGEMLSRMWGFLTEEPREANTEGGVFPAIFGTVVMTLVMTMFVTPLGVIAAIYLREYARQGTMVRIVRICVNNLAGVPSIVFGVFGLAFFVYFVGTSIDELLYADKLPTPTYGTPGILWASLTLALLTLPVVIVATEEALSAVPRGVREAALACGASKWQAIQRIVIPASLPGILTGIILAMARGAGEVAPLMLVGAVKLAPSLPIDDIAPFVHPERKFMHLGFHIFDLGFQSPDADAARPTVYATALLLILLVLVLNLTAIIIRNRLKKRFAVSHF